MSFWPSGMRGAALINTVEKVSATTKTCLPNLWKKILMTMMRDVKCLMTGDRVKGLNLPEVCRIYCYVALLSIF